MTLPPASEIRRDRELREEARHFHAALFREEIPAELEEGYVRAHDHHCRDNADAALLSTIVARRLDVEAIELVLRRTRPALTRKLRVLLYLAEARPSHYPRLVNEADRPVRAWLSLGGAMLRTGFKYVKGRLLLRRYRVV
jgi:hypothetical protein